MREVEGWHSRYSNQSLLVQGYIPSLRRRCSSPSLSPSCSAGGWRTPPRSARCTWPHPRPALSTPCPAALPPSHLQEDGEHHHTSGAHCHEHLVAQLDGLGATGSQIGAVAQQINERQHLTQDRGAGGKTISGEVTGSQVGTLARQINERQHLAGERGEGKGDKQSREVSQASGIASTRCECVACWNRKSLNTSSWREREGRTGGQGLVMFAQGVSATCWHS